MTSKRLYFKNFNNFLNEANNDRLLKRAEKLEADAKFAQSKGNNKKAERLLKKAQDLKAKSDNKETNNKDDDGINNIDTNKNINSKEKSGENIDNKEENKTKQNNIQDDKILMQRINNWNTNHAQNFKFKNDEPKDTDIKDDNPTGQLEVLKQKLSDNYKSAAIDSLTNLVNLLSNKIFNGKSIVVIGFTSSTGTDSYNKSLSIRRSRLVINAIKDIMINKKIDNYNNIKFIVDGKGEEKNRRVVINDTSSNEQSIIVGPNYDEKSVKSKLEGNKDTKENRQELNRRVEISLPNIVPKYAIKTDVETQKIETKEEKPVSPDPTEITFNYNSYILTEKSKNILKSFSDSIKDWNSNENNDKIDIIYMTAHTHIPRSATKSNKEFHFILSANRATMVKMYLENQKIGVEIEIIPVGYDIPNNDGDDKRVEIKFSEDEFIKKAKVIFAKLATEFKVNEVEGFYNNDNNNIIKNVPLRKIILKTIDARREKKVIPIELWDEELSKKERDVERFKNRVRKQSGLTDDQIVNIYVFERQ